MRDREEEIRKAAEGAFPDRFRESCARTARYCEEHSGEVVRHFLEAFRRSADQTACLQEQGKKGKVRYILFSYLHSSLFLRRYLIRIDMMDAGVYSDCSPAESYWDAGCLYRLFEEDVEAIREIVGSNVPRIRAYEVDAIRYAYAPYYHRMARSFIQAMLEVALAEGGLLPERVGREGEVRALFGEYMGQADVLFILKG